MKAEGRHLKMKPTRANSWRRTSFSDRARFTGYLVLRRSPQLFFSFPFPSLSKTRTLFPSFKRINRVYRFDGLLWNLAKMFLGYLCEKGWEHFLIFQIRLLLSALMWRRSANIQFANFKIDFLVNQSEYRKSLTPFCSLSATDWHCAVCLVVLAITKAGNSV